MSFVIFSNILFFRYDLVYCVAICLNLAYSRNFCSTNLHVLKDFVPQFLEVKYYSKTQITFYMWNSGSVRHKYVTCLLYTHITLDLISDDHLLLDVGIFLFFPTNFTRQSSRQWILLNLSTYRQTGLYGSVVGFKHDIWTISCLP